MPSDFFAANMEILKRLYPPLAEELENAAENLSSDGDGLSSEDLTIEASASGSPTLACRGVYVHSKRDPVREAARLVESALTQNQTQGASAAENEDPLLVLGFGLGYAAVALAQAQASKKRPIIIVEKHPLILKKALASSDLTNFLTSSRLVFVLGGSGASITGALSLFKSSPGIPPLIIQNRALMNLDAEWYSGVEQRIKTWNSRTNVNRATQKRFGKRWVRNLSKNLAAVHEIPGISRLEGILRKNAIPVFLAAGGPTLDAAAPIVGEITKRCVTVAVDTSLRFFVSRGIAPDFVVSVDPQYWNFRHLDRVKAHNTHLIAESAVYPPVLRHTFAGAFLCGSLFPLSRFIEEKVDPKGDLGSGGSVATSAWDFARHLGTSEVWLSGLDLSFPGLKTHFRGAAFEEKSGAESTRFLPGETWRFRSLRDGQPFLAKRQGGGNVLTDKRLSLYAAWFENCFSRFPHIKNRCLSEDGLAIPGIESASIEEFLALPERREEINCLLGEVFAAVKSDFQGDAAAERAKKYENARRELLNGLIHIKNITEDAAEIAETAARRSKQGRLSEKDQEKAMKKLNAATETMTESAVKEIAGFLFPETSSWEAEIAALTADHVSRHLEFSSRFFRALTEAAAFNLRVLG